MNKCLIVLIMGLATIGLGTDIIAETEQKSVWELGAEMSSITYKEPGVMEETGIMMGLVGSYAYHKERFIGKVELRYTTGDVDYDGQTQSGTPLKMSNIPNVMKEFRLLGGIKLGQPKTPTPILYIGLGSRYLNDDSSGKVGGYERQSYYRYMPLGINIDMSSDRATVWMTVEYDFFLGGTQTSCFSDVAPGLNDVENEQDDGYGFRCAIGFESKNGVTKLFIRRWNIKDSDLADITYYGTTIGYGQEPKNNSTEMGLSWAWRF